MLFIYQVSVTEKNCHTKADSLHGTIIHGVAWKEDLYCFMFRPWGYKNWLYTAGPWLPFSNIYGTKMIDWFYCRYVINSSVVHMCKAEQGALYPFSVYWGKFAMAKEMESLLNWWLEVILRLTSECIVNGTKAWPPDKQLSLRSEWIFRASMGIQLN